MRDLAAVVALVACILTTGCASTGGEGAASASFDFTSVDKVAVVSVRGALRGAGARGQITDLFNLHLLKRGYTPIERQRIQAVLDEQEFQASGPASRTQAREVGRILGAGAVILVNVPEYRDDMSMSARMVTVDTGSIVWTASGTAATGVTGSTIAGGLLGGVAGAQTSGGDAATAVGAIGGGLAGRSLSPEKQEQASALIEKLTESLPAITAER